MRARVQVSGEKEFFAQMVVDAVSTLDSQVSGWLVWEPRMQEGMGVPPLTSSSYPAIRGLGVILRHAVRLSEY